MYREQYFVKKQVLEFGQEVSIVTYTNIALKIIAKQKQKNALVGTHFHSLRHIVFQKYQQKYFVNKSNQTSSETMI